jgi:uncharacterized damage-inducible protein DinB
MTTDSFIQTILQKGKEADDRISSGLSGISNEQLNWKPSPESWSIGQCLEHLIKTHSFYIPVFKKIAAGNYKMSFWQRFSPFTATWGKIFKKQLGEEPKIKLKAAKKIKPTLSTLRSEIIQQYHESLADFLESISHCEKADLDRIIITSPFVSAVTYNLRDSFQFLLQHEHRHINQAFRVMSNENFPKQ